MILSSVSPTTLLPTNWHLVPPVTLVSSDSRCLVLELLKIWAKNAETHPECDCFILTELMLLLSPQWLRGG